MKVRVSYTVSVPDWWRAEAEAPDGSVPIVSFRRSRSDWYSIIGTDDLARLLA